MLPVSAAGALVNTNGAIQREHLLKQLIQSGTNIKNLKTDA